MKQYLFTTPQCPSCPRAKSLLTGKNVEFELIDASTPAGLGIARLYSIHSVPAFVTLDKTGKVETRFSGLAEISASLSSSCSLPDSKK